MSTWHRGKRNLQPSRAILCIGVTVQIWLLSFSLVTLVATGSLLFVPGKTVDHQKKKVFGLVQVEDESSVW